MGITKGLSFSYGLKVRRSQAGKESEGREKKMYIRPEEDLVGKEFKAGWVLEHSSKGEWPGVRSKAAREASTGVIESPRAEGRVLFILSRMGNHTKKI